MQSTPVDFLAARNEAVELLGEPCTIAMTGRRVEPVRVDLRGQDGQLAEPVSQFLTCRLDDRA